MPGTLDQTIINLETKFWQSMVDNDADTAVDMLTEPALIVSGHGALKFDRAQYRKMADEGPVVVKSFEFSNVEVVFANETTAVLAYRVKQGIGPRGKDETTFQEMNDTSTWVQNGGKWECVLHTETPAGADKPGQ